MPPATARSAPSPTITFLEARVGRDPDDIIALNRLSAAYLGRFRQTSGDDADLDRAFRAAEQSLKSVPAEVNAGGVAARARAAIALHRFAAARDDARQLAESEPHKPAGHELLGDALLELGDYAGAAAAYARVQAVRGEDDPVATTEVRLARLAIVRGDRAGAARRFDAAVEVARATSGSPPELLAWALVQAGQFAFSSGRWDDAERHYLSALEAKPDDWAALDRLAELRAAQKRHGEGVDIYERLVARVARPELFQALGDVYRDMNRPDDARVWHARAAAAYRQSIDRGATHYLHHLSGFYCDAEPNAAEAVRIAREDLALRQGVYAYDALAWALYQAGDVKSAVDAADKALATNVADAHVLYHASLIYARAGDVERGRACLKMAAEVNPRFLSFHVHR